MIGIVGGLGPYSGIDLLKKVFDNTIASSDQEHLDAVLISTSSKIEDRTEYLIGNIKENPAIVISEVIVKLQAMGVTVVGIQCNTAHSEKIFNKIIYILTKANINIQVLNMIEETSAFITINYPNISKVSILSTTGTNRSGVYTQMLQSNGYEVILISLEMQETLIHTSIYDSIYGIKTKSNPIHPQVRKNLLKVISFLKEQGAQAVILGCTEISLAITEKEIDDMIIIDPTTVLARALIRHSNSSKLKPL